MDLRDEIVAWRKKIGLDQLQPYDTGEISWALNVGKELNSMEPNEIGEVLLVLSNLLFTVSEQMGSVFARVKYLETVGPKGLLATERAKLNIVKPFHDSIQTKIAIVKKVYDYKVKEALNASSSRR